jgi:diadenosine tetraphosphatase ApaH/serine/threonine PP2A family protein phosphatase
MRVVLVADVHSNLAALKAVLRHAESAVAIDAVWAMGDLVGYGPDPDACLEMLRRYPLTAVGGNHDRAAVGSIGTEDFNPYAAAAARWTAANLVDEHASFLRDLPDVAVEGQFTLVHGSLRDPVWEYLLSEEQALAQFSLQDTPYSLIGHSHVQIAFFEQADRPPIGQRFDDGMSIPLDGPRFIANPGGLGQPRDGDPRAAYALLDTQRALLSFHRVEYDIASTQKRMRAAGLPDFLVERLARGR